jgi:putative transposase
MADPSTMYRWRKMTPSQREAALKQRRESHRPLHSPPHYDNFETSYFMITAACFEHRPVIGNTPERMTDFESSLLAVLHASCRTVFAWTVLPNHYHVLVDIESVKGLLAEIGKLHGRSSFDWNGEDNQRGRQVWCNAAETEMKSEGHYYATLNYVLNNAVHHGYVHRWSEWPYCNAAQYLDTFGREKALAIWRAYPLFDYGKDWDPPER